MSGSGSVGGGRCDRPKAKAKSLVTSPHTPAVALLRSYLLVCEFCMSKSNSKKSNGRGRSAGSRKTQFSREYQPKRSRKKKEPEEAPPQSALAVLRAAIYQNAKVTKNGQPVEMPFIDLLMQTMVKNAASGKLIDQLRLFRELNYSGVFDTEEYKEQIEDEVYAIYGSHVDKLLSFSEKVTSECIRTFSLYKLYFYAFIFLAHDHPNSSPDTALNKAHIMLRALVAADWDDELIDQEALEAELKAVSG